MAAKRLPKAVLTLTSQSGFPVYHVRDLLADLDHAYNYALVAQILLNTPFSEGRWRDVDPFEPIGRFGRWVRRPNRLVLQSVELHSPGDFKLIGSIFPLEQIREYLNDRHERKKDKAYRSDEERERLRLENEARELQNAEAKLALREKEASLEGKIEAERENRALDLQAKRNALLSQQIEIARAAGTPDEVIQAIVRNFIIQPISGLDSYQDMGLLGEASVDELTPRGTPSSDPAPEGRNENDEEA